MMTRTEFVRLTFCIAAGVALATWLGVQLAQWASR